MFWQIILQIFLIILNAVFAGAETAIISINNNKLEKNSENGSKKAVKLLEMTDNFPDILASVQIAITFSGFICSALCADCFSPRIVTLLHSAGLTGYDNILEPVAIVAVTLALSCIMIVFGELVPKRIALRNPEKTAVSVVSVLSAVRFLLAPLVRLLNFSSEIILKIIGINSDGQTNTVTEEEIIMMSDAGAEKGTIDETENRIIKNIFAFDDMTAEQVCTHRTDVDVLWSNDTVEVWEETIHRTRHSKFPVCDETIDHVIGILNAKDYFRLDDKSHDNIMKNAVREPYFVHENMKADSLFAQMRKNGGHPFAVVVDEYGGMSGIITITDLVEELVGDFDDDESNQPEIKFLQTSENEWLIPGITSLDDVCEKLEISLPVEKYDTFGGYVIDFLGEIPKNSTAVSFDCDGLHIEIIEINRHRIKSCRVSKIKD